MLLLLIKMTPQNLTKQPSTTIEYWTCSSCNHEVAGWRSACDKCRTTKDDYLVYQWDGKRPKGLTAYILLMATVSICLLIYLVSRHAHEDIIGLGFMAIVLLDLVVAWGLWNLRNWARIAVIVLRSLVMLLSIIGLFMGSFASITPAIISFVIVRWFFDNGHLFQSSPKLEQTRS